MKNHYSSTKWKKQDHDNWMISSKRDQTQRLEFELSKERKLINQFYFGGKESSHKKYKKPRFVSRHSRENLEFLWFPFLKNLYCDYTSYYNNKRKTK